MSKLVRLNEITDEQILNDLFNSEITILEDIQGSKIYVNWDGKEFTIKPKSLSSDPLNLIDLAIQNYYNHAINYFNSLDNRVKGLLNKNWHFCFEFFPDENPACIVYNRVPKNHLVLSSIVKGNKFTYIIDEIEEYARLFDVDSIPVIFKGCNFIHVSFQKLSLWERQKIIQLLSIVQAKIKSFFLQFQIISQFLRYVLKNLIKLL